MENNATPHVTPTTNSLNQTHDFMNVDSFSQLPFIRPPPSAANSSSSSSAPAIRLFGIDFSSSPPNTSTPDSGDFNNRESSHRKFECHYCCRNFPTSQALGGHQNAHKRERQHARRAHLHSAAVLTTDYHYHHHHLYGLSTSYFPPSNFHYRSSNSLSTAASRYTYHHQHNSHYPVTITGSPVSVRRFPTAVHSNSSQHHNYMSAMHPDRSLHPLPFFARSTSPSFNRIQDSASEVNTDMDMDMDMDINTNMNMNVNMSMSSYHSQYRRGNGGDQVSLDLHL